MPLFCFWGRDPPERKCRFRILTVVVIFSSMIVFWAAITKGAELET
jgi:hypothetical protein